MARNGVGRNDINTNMSAANRHADRTERAAARDDSTLRSEDDQHSFDNDTIPTAPRGAARSRQQLAKDAQNVVNSLTLDGGQTC